MLARPTFLVLCKHFVFRLRWCQWWRWWTRRRGCSSYIEKEDPKESWSIESKTGKWQSRLTILGPQKSRAETVHICSWYLDGLLVLLAIHWVHELFLCSLSRCDHRRLKHGAILQGSRLQSLPGTGCKLGLGNANRPNLQGSSGWKSRWSTSVVVLAIFLCFSFDR